MSQGICNTCIYYKPWKEEGRGCKSGECRRSAPRLRLGGYDGEDSVAWPPVEAGDWCGEYQRNPQISMFKE